MMNFLKDIFVIIEDLQRCLRGLNNKLVGNTTYTLLILIFIKTF